MLKQSFIFLDRITSGGERKLWAQGIDSWNAFRKAQKISGIGQKRRSYYELRLQECEEAFQRRDLTTLARLLPKNQQWRLFPLFKEKALYVDIETAERYGDITVLGAWDGECYYSFVKGCNLEKSLVAELFSQYELFVTFNGSSFDLPIIERFFGGVLPADYLHIDLRYVCAKLNLSGGLKAIERVVGLSRKAEIDGMSGGEAALLWHEYLLTGDEKHIELLLEYNEADCRNLEPLATWAIATLWSRLREV